MSRNDRELLLPLPVSSRLILHACRLVFNDYTWDTGRLPYSRWEANIIPSRIPMSALIAGMSGPKNLTVGLLYSQSGPLAGGPFPQGDDVPRAVMKDYFNRVCPMPLVLDHQTLIFRLPWNYSAGALMDEWVELLNSTSERCVEINHVVFNIG